MVEVVADTLLEVGLFRRWIDNLERVIGEQAHVLTRLDAEIGDGDHGINMSRGMRSAVAALEETPQVTPGSLLELVGRQLVLTVGGAAGPLYGTAFLQAGKTLGEGAASLADLAAAFDAALAGVQQLGAAEIGDKTMVDAFLPAVVELQNSVYEGTSLPEALDRAASAAEMGMVATIPLRALKGRASYLGARSEGHQDPGATSTALLFRSLADAAC
jgi:phosphoenolpyruvate---glycerone phosphotransferase subunit DhaL